MKKSVKINQKLSKTNQKLRRKDSDSEIIAKREREWNFCISKTVSTGNTQQGLRLVVK